MNNTIKALRLQTGLSQTEFGKRLGGIPLRIIRNWESGERTPPAWTLELIAYRVEHDDNIKNQQSKSPRIDPRA
jgi:DNA-binding transcriptional regulator YiaG